MIQQSYHKQIRLSYSRSTLTRHLVPTRSVNDVYLLVNALFCETADQLRVRIESLTVKSANSLLKSAARLSPPDSSRIKLHPCFIVSSSQASMFAVISSRIAACGQPPASQLSQYHIIAMHTRTSYLSPLLLSDQVQVPCVL